MSWEIYRGNLYRNQRGNIWYVCWNETLSRRWVTRGISMFKRGVSQTRSSRGDFISRLPEGWGNGGSLLGNSAREYLHTETQRVLTLPAARNLFAGTCFEIHARLTSSWSTVFEHVLTFWELIGATKLTGCTRPHHFLLEPRCVSILSIRYISDCNWRPCTKPCGVTCNSWAHVLK